MLERKILLHNSLIVLECLSYGLTLYYEHQEYVMIDNELCLKNQDTQLPINVSFKMFIDICENLPEEEIRVLEKKLENYKFGILWKI